MPVSMHIIGKISEGNLTSLNMIRSSALLGKLKTLSRHMQMDASMSTDVLTPTDGKNKSTILQTIRCMLVDNQRLVPSLIVHIFIRKRIEEWH